MKFHSQVANFAIVRVYIEPQMISVLTTQT